MEQSCFSIIFITSQLWWSNHSITSWKWALDLLLDIFSPYHTLFPDVNKLLVTSKLSQFEFGEKDVPLRNEDLQERGVQIYHMIRFNITSSKLRNEIFLRAPMFTSNIWPSQLMKSPLFQKRRYLFIGTSFLI